MNEVCRLLAAASILLLSACAAGPQLQIASPGPQRLELESTPFHPQEIHQCGPAALATLLQSAAIDVTPETLVPQVYIPGREGSLQAELIAAVRRYSLVPYRPAPRMEDLVANIQEGRPVLVLQNLALRSWPRWHYAVLVGYDSARNSVVLRSGRKRRQIMSLRRFERSWELAGRWALVAADPSTPPQTATADAWIAASAGFESLGRLSTAEQAYAAAGVRWPKQPLVWQALANIRYAQHDLLGAEAALRQALMLKPEAATRNNLAQVLLDRGCISQARATLDEIEQIPPALRAAIQDTRQAIERASAVSEAACHDGSAYR